MNQATLEIASDCPVFAAQTADRIDRFEICSDLHQEGWTASPELMRRFMKGVGERAEVHALIRPRIVRPNTPPQLSDFILDAESLARSVEQVEQAGRTRLQGIAIGPCTAEGKVDRESARVLCDVARRHRLDVGFHRAFDLLEDRHRALDVLAEMGIRRILSSGSRGWTLNPDSTDRRIEVIRSLCERASRLAGDSISIVACGGVRASNAASFLAATGHLHSSCREAGRPDLPEARAIADAVSARRARFEHSQSGNQDSVSEP